MAEPEISAEETRQVALRVLRYNVRGPFAGLPRTAAWGYPEPYTRDMMISALGMLASGDDELIDAVRRVLEALAQHQSSRGHIPSLAHDSEDRGASDTTPLFLIGLACYRRTTGDARFLDDAAHKALTWLEYQSPGDHVMVGQLPTSDWRDEQWVLGFGLYVNMLLYLALRLFGDEPRAADLRRQASHFVIGSDGQHRHVHEGLVVPYKPYYALWAYKIFSSERFDLLGNSLAVISGLASHHRARALIRWVEDECDALRKQHELAVALPPNLLPYIRPHDPDWLPRYREFNRPGEYHNGGIWPFICAFYVVATLAAGFPQLAARQFAALTRLVRASSDPSLPCGFNEWIRAQDGTPRGNDWQTWSAAMYLYAATCLDQGHTIFFEEMRKPAEE